MPSQKPTHYPGMTPYKDDIDISPYYGCLPPKNSKLSRSSWLLVPKAAAPLHEEARDTVFYHGTSDESAAQAILAGGIQPREITMPDKAKSRGFLAPARGRVYLTPDVRYAAIYALGGDIFGSKGPKGFYDDKSPYGYIFALQGSEISGDVVPDEDSIGEMLSQHYQYLNARKSLPDAEAAKPDPRYPKSHLFRLEHIQRRIEYGSKKPINQPDVPRSVQDNLHTIVDRYLTPKQRENITADEIATQAMIGKKLQKYLSTETVKWMLDHGAHAAHLGAIFPTRAWRFKKTDAATIKKEDVLSICEEIPIPARKTAAGEPFFNEATSKLLPLDEPWGPSGGETSQLAPDMKLRRIRVEGVNLYKFSKLDDKGEPIAYLIVFETDHENKVAEISGVYVEPNYRRKGIGSELMGYARKIFNKVEHSTQISPAGDAWRAKVGAAESPNVVSEKRGAKRAKLLEAGYNEDAYKNDRDEYRGDVKPDMSDTDYDQYFHKGKEWEQSSLAALSTGKLTLEECRERKILQYGTPRADQFKPLPQHLYHVTTAASKVKQDGLMSRWELSMGEGVGLGGGDDKSISFTTDLKIAESIYNSIIEGRKVARGEFTIQEMFEIAKKGGGGVGHPWVDRFKKYFESYVGGGEIAFNGYLHGMKCEFGYWGGPPKDKGDGWTPMKEEHHWPGGDGEERYSWWERPMTPEEKLEANWGAFKAFAPAREAEGGAIDPLFFSTDVKALAAVNENEIAILECRPVPGAMGIQQSALGEIRTYSGKAVTLVKAFKPQSKTGNSGRLVVMPHALSKQASPEIARFDGISIELYYNDHDPPHFHALSGGKKIKLLLPDGELDKHSQATDAAVQRKVGNWLHQTIPTGRRVSDLVYDEWLHVRNHVPTGRVPTPDEIKVMKRPSEASDNKKTSRHVNNHYQMEEVTPLPGFRLQIKFKNGETRIVDIKKMRGDHPMFQTVFEDFNSLRQSAWDIRWFEGLDQREIQDEDLWAAGNLIQHRARLLQTV